VGDYVMQARGVIFGEFPIDLGTARQLSAVVSAPIISLNRLAISGSQVKILFSVAGSASTYRLLQATRLNGTWTTNFGAILTTNSPGSSFQFVTTNGPATQFYRVQTP
jgi:hypothetical protein